MNARQIVVAYTRKVRTGEYENADVSVSETFDLAPGEDPKGAELLIFRRLRATVDEWADLVRG